MTLTASPDDNEPDVLRVQRISRETVEHLRQLKKDMQISTGKIERAVTDAINRSGLAGQVQRHEQKIVEHDGIFAAMKRGFSQFLAKL